MLFDEVVARAAPGGEYTNPWVGKGVYKPDLAVLEDLLGCVLSVIPDPLDTQSGVAALALDVWLAYELRRAGFERENVWPRATRPRVIPPDISVLLNGLPQSKEAPELRRRLEGARPPKGVVSATANILGRNYIKQVDVVMSSWATGPEILISTKRMDAAYGKNAANRIEEANGDAKNLRGRHPLAALGFVFGLSAAAFEEDPNSAHWIVDQLEKLNDESDAYEAVSLIVPKYTIPPSVLNERERKRKARSAARAGLPLEDQQETEALVEPGADAAGIEAVPSPVPDLDARLRSLPKVKVDESHVPERLRPATFLAEIVTFVLKSTPITMHREARVRGGWRYIDADAEMG
ncbi:hypothetical protein [Microbacterium sp. zg-YB36]|uniref:hypothetical protein n=1 Tax=Microbacterium sp. zg-YB36 TaxID=2969407 RepID=UPI00214BE6FB|nr:hypothetical protein [Microbacterium sp. zg-YB36]MDL5352172.1 hypothetical protein [Microbacterium sp. zg-YB36]